MIENGTIMSDATPDTDKVMLCGNMDFNVEIRDMLKSRDWVQGSRKTPGSFVLERAFVG
jgi:ferredoxin--NADP+ reductase